MISSLWSMLVQNENGLPIPILPPKYVKWSFLQWLVKMMDEYRDIRLLWTVVESILMVLIVVLVFYFIYQVKLVERCLRERFKKLDERIKKISELHKRADELEEEQGE